MSDSEALELALALHATPQRAGQLRARPLPAEGVTSLLRLALAQPEALAHAAQETGLPAELLIDSARFFVEQQMLVEDCESDPWRVLGLPPGSAEQQLRDHHRLLVRLVHPDRSSDWPAAFADRVNKAWRQLRRPEDRVTAASNAVSLPVGEGAQVAPYRPSFAAPSRSLLPATATRLRYLPLALVGGIVLTAAALLWLDGWVTANYGGEPALVESASAPAAAGGRVDRRGAPQTSPRAGSETSSVTGAEAPREVPNRAPTDAETGAAQGLVAFFSYLGSTWDAHQRMRESQGRADVVDAVPPPVARPQSQPALQARPLPAVAQRRPLRAESGAEPPIQAVAVSAPPVRQAIVAAPLTVPDTRNVPVFRPDPAVVSVANEPVDSSADLVEESEAQVRQLLQRFGTRYREGDLLGLLELFALDANADKGGVPSLAAEYSQVFGATQSRDIRFDGVHWVLDGERIRGGAGVQIETLAPGRTQRSVSRSHIEFEVRLDGGQTRIMRWVASTASGGA